MNNNAGFPSWMLIAVVVGFAQLTYWVYGRYGTGLAFQAALGATVLAGIICLAVYIGRVIKRRNNKR